MQYFCTSYIHRDVKWEDSNQDSEYSRRQPWTGMCSMVRVVMISVQCVHHRKGELGTVQTSFWTSSFKSESCEQKNDHHEAIQGKIGLKWLNLIVPDNASYISPS